MTDEEFAELADNVQLIRDLAQSRGWEVFADRAVAELASHQRLILAGRLELADYQRETGWLAGASTVLELPAIVEREFERVVAERALELAEREAEREAEAEAATA